MGGVHKQQRFSLVCEDPQHQHSPTPSCAYSEQHLLQMQTLASAWVLAGVGLPASACVCLLEAKASLI